MADGRFKSEVTGASKPRPLQESIIANECGGQQGEQEGLGGMHSQRASAHKDGHRKDMWQATERPLPDL